MIFSKNFSRQRTIINVLVIPVAMVFSTVTGYSCTPPPQPPVIDFQATPSSVPQGDQSTLTWHVSGASNIEIDNGIGKVAPQGQTIIKPAATTTYWLTARDGGVVTIKDVRVVVMPRAVTQAPVEMVPALSAISESSALLKYLGKKVDVSGVVTHIEYTSPRASPGEKWACIFFNENGAEGVAPGYTANQSPWDFMAYFRAIVKPENMDKLSQFSSRETRTGTRWVSRGANCMGAGMDCGYNETYTYQVEIKLGKLTGQNITVSGTIDVKDSAPVIYLLSPDQIKVSK